MDFGDTPEEAAFRARAHAWLAENASPRVQSTVGPIVFDDRQTPDFVPAARAWQSRKAAAGWAGVTWPREYGGQGLSPVYALIWDQEETQFETPPNLFTVGLNFIGHTLIALGTTAQKQRYLARLLSGDDIWCQLFSEPAAGSDLASLTTRAVRQADGTWIVNGHKIWTSRGHLAERGLLLARTGTQEERQRGLTAFVVDMRARGVRVEPIRQLTGRSNFCEVFFENVTLSDADRVGEVGDGWTASRTSLGNERLNGAARADRDGNFVMEQLIRLAQRTDTGGARAIDDAAVRERLASYYVRVKSIQYSSYRVKSAVSAGVQPGPEVSIAKLAFGGLMQEMSSYALELRARGSALDDSDEPGNEPIDWHHVFLRAAGLRISGGTDEIQRNIIAERILGLPREPRSVA